ncbi:MULTISPECIES: SDR family oxidoreductase [Cyanophyceae]|uniref:SDR family oxidoreductase n=1 Tax=Leptolyngbya subtilissima DQ-A4 TaxID=2933933 RepID=A0ABV0JYW9_9CYAN|nr:SDR family oxidoreductase [Nodosilinea sp. FACHB-141]MBD2112359.1 SDR family oxidoreductase [Nodosilinea sp. FACHB-141]
MASPVVIVTGCSSGIGKALCQAFHRQGCRVVATARRLEAIDDLKAQGILTLPLDVTDSVAMNSVIDTVLAQIGRIDILVNNAGFGQFGPLMDLSPAQIHAQFQTNVLAPFELMQQVAPVMKEQRSGTIVNIGSISGIVTTPFSGAYSASKAALHSLSEALRMELAPFGIHVVTVQPGAIQSNFGQAADQGLTGVLSPDSWYAPLESKIRARAVLSQANATPVHDFAEQLVALVMKPHPPTTIRLGRKSRWLPLLKRLLPPKLMDFLLKRQFGLTQMPR